jgi:Do/DeqQ family serine protease
MNRILLVVFVAAMAGGIIGALLTLHYRDSESPVYNSVDSRQQWVLAGSAHDSIRIPAGIDFRAAAGRSVSAVVHIKTSMGMGNFSSNPFDSYFDIPTRSSGSGVIVTDDGYIVTNNHVIEDATNIEVVLNNNQHYYAKLIGTDPSTDLALLKIKCDRLPFIRYGDSDKVIPGEWVLAIGNPFDLNSTVTAGIVSAKARNIGILRDRNNLQIESFIQTDAAVNPGNSGGALVNLNGDLIGINTAIATSSGSYQGYSFAIPVTLVRKVIDDLLEFGTVQRGLLGIQIQDLDARLADEMKLTTSQGVLITRVNEGGAAEASGLQPRDVIVGIDNHAVRNVSELQEMVARHRPGVEVIVSYLRGGQPLESIVKLKNYRGSNQMESSQVPTEHDGSEFETVPYSELARLGLDGGVRLVKLGEGAWSDAGLREGFVIAYIDKIPVENLKDLSVVLGFKNGGILIEGYYGDKRTVYGVDW